MLIEIQLLGKVNMTNRRRHYCAYLIVLWINHIQPYLGKIFWNRLTVDCAVRNLFKIT
jgi:hypothetical protein